METKSNAIVNPLFAGKPRVTPWLHTKAGQIFAATVLGGASLSVFSGYVLVHIPFLNKYKEFVQMYRNGLPVPLDPEVKKRAEKVLENSGLSEPQRNKFEFFTVYGHEPFHAGSTNLRGSVIIGLPHTYACKKKSEIDTSTFKVYNKDSVSWFTEGQGLLDSLILSENAQKFSIAREIYFTTRHYVYSDAGYASLSIIFSGAMAMKINRQFNLFKAPLRLRLSLYSLTSAFGFVCYMALRDSTRQKHDRYADRKAAELGSEYLEGGIEFYEKSLLKNKALRELMGSDGESTYTPNGNENFLIRTPRLPLTNRLDNLKEMQNSPKSSG